MNSNLMKAAAKSLSHQQLFELFEITYKAYKNNPSPYTFLPMSEAFTVIMFKRAIEDGIDDKLIDEVQLRNNLAEQYKGRGITNQN